MRSTAKLGDIHIALLLACATAILLTVTAPAIGLTWDEPAYIAGADSIAAWFGVLIKSPGQAFQSETIDQYWIINHEHPPVQKIWSGWVWSAAQHFLDELTASRLGVMLMVSFLVALLYLLVAKMYGRAAGLFAAAALLSMPRFFFHSHLAALDVPVAVGAFAVTFLFWKTIDRKQWWWGILLGIAWGLVVATKLNGVFIPIALVTWVLVFRRQWRMVFRLFLMGIFAILTFFAVWPWLYHQPWMRVLEYINFHIHHVEIGQWYFGQFYLPPPWHFVPVILWAVLPLTVLLLSLIGMAQAGRGRRDQGLAWLMIISVLVSIAPFLFEKSLLYDNDRLFMPVYPFLAALAGIGFGWILAGLRKLMGRIKRPIWNTLASILLAAALLTPQSVAMAGLYPHLLSYYSEGVGGLRGATRLGLETTYWCETYAAALPYLNEHAKPGDLIWVEPWSFDVLLYYQMIGRLRPDVKVMNPDFAQSVFGPYTHNRPVIGDFRYADWYIFQYRQTQFGTAGENYYPLMVLESQQPVFEVEYQGIPLMRLYGKLK